MPSLGALAPEVAAPPRFGRSLVVPQPPMAARENCKGDGGCMRRDRGGMEDATAAAGVTGPATHPTGALPPWNARADRKKQRHRRNEDILSRLPGREFFRRSGTGDGPAAGRAGGWDQLTRDWMAGRSEGGAKGMWSRARGEGGRSEGGGRRAGSERTAGGRTADGGNR